MSGSSEAEAPRSTGWWKCRALRPDGTAAWLAHVGGGLHPDHVVVELPVADAVELLGEDAVCIARYEHSRVVRVELTSRGAPKAPDLWFAEVADDGPPPATTLVVFSGHDVEAGTLLDLEAFERTGAESTDQLGAIRWYPETGEVDQVYVSPDWRRRSIGSALVVAAGTLAVARGWARLWGDGQRTALGDRWRSTSDWAHRTAPLTHLAPPMTPFDER